MTKKTMPLLRRTCRPAREFCSMDRRIPPSEPRDTTKFYVTGCRKHSEAVVPACHPDAGNVLMGTTSQSPGLPRTGGKIAVLRRLITICAWGKKIRDKKGGGVSP